MLLEFFKKLFGKKEPIVDTVSPSVVPTPVEQIAVSSEKPKRKPRAKKPQVPQVPQAKVTKTKQAPVAAKKAPAITAAKKTRTRKSDK